MSQEMGLSVENSNGLYVQTTNQGRHQRDEFAVIPEVEVLLKYRVTQRLHATFGYSFLYVANVLRPGDHIDPVLDTESILVVPRLIGGPPRPTFEFDDAGFWAQGLNFGVEICY